MYRTLLPIACCLLPLVAFADAQIQMVAKDGTVDGTYQVRGGKVRIESTDSGNNTLLYDAASHGITVLDHAKKHYMHIDAETVANLGAAASGAMAEMQKQLANLPPEQREAMEKLMPAMPTAPSLPDIKADRTGRSDVVNGMSCEIVEVAVDGKAAGEACVASKGTGLSDSDEQTLRSMFADLSKLASSVLGGNSGTDREFAVLGGLPLRWRDNTGRVTETRVDTKVPIDATGFQIPAGYTEEKLEVPSLN
jgi:hypothetical protein